MLQIRSLSHTYANGTQALSDVSLDIQNSTLGVTSTVKGA